MSRSHRFDQTGRVHSIMTLYDLIYWVLSLGHLYVVDLIFIILLRQIIMSFPPKLEPNIVVLNV